MDQIRQAHARMLTVDAHIEAALNLLKPGWDIGERHSSRKAGGSQVDLPRMKEGGLDAAFFVICKCQGYRRWAPRGAWEARTRLIISRDGSSLEADRSLGRSVRRGRRLGSKRAFTSGFGLLHNPLQFP